MMRTNLYIVLLVAVVSLVFAQPRIGQPVHAQTEDAKQAQDAKETSAATDNAAKAEDVEETLEAVLAGHSFHGDAFNEGPRQKAYLMGGTGNVRFPVTTESQEAQAFINQGVGQLHGFWYLEAERSFRQAAAIDPDCAMAYWGAAMAAHADRKRAKGFIDEAVERKEKTTEREKKIYLGVRKVFL